MVMIICDDHLATQPDNRDIRHLQLGLQFKTHPANKKTLTAKITDNWVGYYDLPIIDCLFQIFTISNLLCGSFGGVAAI